MALYCIHLTRLPSPPDAACHHVRCTKAVISPLHPPYLPATAAHLEESRSGAFVWCWPFVFRNAAECPGGLPRRPARSPPETGGTRNAAAGTARRRLADGHQIPKWQRCISHLVAPSVQSVLKRAMQAPAAVCCTTLGELSTSKARNTAVNRCGSSDTSSRPLTPDSAKLPQKRRICT
jgi:hypothetical protein